MAQEVLIAGGPSRAKIRNPWGVFGLLLITLGIYSIFWWYYVNREMRDYGQATGNDLGQNPGLSAVAWFPGSLIIVPHIVTAWRGTLRAQSSQRVAGVPLLNGWIALILYILLSIAFPSFIQSELNKVWRKVGTPLAGEPLPPQPEEGIAPEQDAPPPPAS
jgi:hypothetical protein